MIPLRDNIPSRTTPVVNYTMIGLCTIVFLMQMQQEDGSERMVEQYGMIPARVTDPNRPIEIPQQQIEQTSTGTQVSQTMRPAAESPIPGWLTLLTCIFLHGGWMHFLGNVWFLHIFGDNVEDCFGHVGYAIFYLAGGILASLAHLLTDPGSMIPTIGASGAIAAVMGGYFVLYPRAHVITLVPIVIILQIFVLPAPFFLGVWFVLQLIQGAASHAGGGVAWWAHIGGFAAGAAAAWLLEKGHIIRPPVKARLPNTDHYTHYRYHRPNRW